MSFCLQITVDVPQLERTNELLAEILRQLKRFHRPPDPERPTPIFTEIADMPGRITFNVQLPPVPENGDVASGELTVKIGNNLTLNRTFSPSDSLLVDEAFVGDQNAPVQLSIIYIDDAGNRSANPGVFEGVLLDTMPPADPGAPGLVITGEV